jgi:uncharacterized membrane protein YhhN
LSLVFTIAYLQKPKAGALIGAWILTGLTVCAMLIFSSSGTFEPLTSLYLLWPVFCIILLIRKMKAVAYKKWLAEVEEEERQRLGKL